MTKDQGRLPLIVRLPQGSKEIDDYRPVEWVASQLGQEVSRELKPVLVALFEDETSWIPGTDAF